ncbi:HAD family hydrolase [Ectobacillus ponti]|uniref:HAD family hydrolase n=1 Tax=Ectobacillus ponti TaxID=2961894 RepID=A0AA42BQ96_9BACI|nr:HAD family hydrolase [Ectobacillus ponti]MCP8969642.1 HAD family hydrolase [Ectobacillus ponti]
MVKAVIFDFDGLIVDTETVWYDVFREVFAEHGCDLPLEVFGKAVGTTDEMLLAHYYQYAKKPVEADELQRLADKRYSGRMLDLQPREGVLDYLQEAKELGLQVGLASSSSRAWIEGFLERFGIRPHFEVLKTKEDVAKVKPDPALYVQAAAALGVRPVEAIAFEDSLNGSIAARRAGLHCVIVPNQVTGHLAFTDYALRLNSMSEKALKDVVQFIRG